MATPQPPDFIILHAGWLDEQLVLWGEVPEASAVRTPRSARNSGTAAAPNGVPGAILATMLHEALPAVVAAETPTIAAIAWLPSTRGGPLSSHALADGATVADGSAGDVAAQFAPWTVEVLGLDPEAALFLLGQGDEHSLLTPGLTLGADLRFWQAVMQLAGTVVARQAFIPSVTMEGGQYRARWLPVIAGQDEARVAQLAVAMPGACRALALGGTEGAAAAPSLAARAVIVRFIAAIVDALVRGAAQSTSMPVGPRVEVEQLADESLHAQWLAALRSPSGRMTGDAQAL
ncbi:MAG TPA: hypothetical protein VGS80_16440, partial [Ktedonobacterales bacterium]|nr:hypothetical protein [Ktedonobacterales bacterium]